MKHIKQKKIEQTKIEYLHNVIVNLTTSLNAKYNFKDELRKEIHELTKAGQSKDQIRSEIELFKLEKKIAIAEYELKVYENNFNELLKEIF